MDFRESDIGVNQFIGLLQDKFNIDRAAFIDDESRSAALSQVASRAFVPKNDNYQNRERGLHPTLGWR